MKGILHKTQDGRWIFGGNFYNEIWSNYIQLNPNQVSFVNEILGECVWPDKLVEFEIKDLDIGGVKDVYGTLTYNPIKPEEPIDEFFYPIYGTFGRNEKLEISQTDADVLFERLENPPPPNSELQNAVKDFEKLTNTRKKDGLKILHLSDTHGFHQQIPDSRFDGIDIVIHSGDCSNWRDSARNFHEVFDFLEWYMRVPVKYKIYVAGNHDTSIERRIINKDHFTDRGIIYLENDSVDIEGIKIFGSPVTPTFGEWAFMKSRETIDRFWSRIEEPMDIFIVHGPPKGILDLTYDRFNDLEMCGCKSLGRNILRLNPKMVLFGHIHNFKDIVNSSVLYRDGIIYSNAACVEDGRFDKGLISTGNILTI